MHLSMQPSPSLAHLPDHFDSRMACSCSNAGCRLGIRPSVSTASTDSAAPQMVLDGERRGRFPVKSTDSMMRWGYGVPYRQNNKYCSTEGILTIPCSCRYTSVPCSRIHRLDFVAVCAETSALSESDPRWLVHPLEASQQRARNNMVLDEGRSAGRPERVITLSLA